MDAPSVTDRVGTKPDLGWMFACGAIISFVSVGAYCWLAGDAILDGSLACDYRTPALRSISEGLACGAAFLAVVFGRRRTMRWALAIAAFIIVGFAGYVAVNVLYTSFCGAAWTL
jgi:hypothetical protein